MKNAKYLFFLLLLSVSSVGQQVSAPKASSYDFVSTGAAFLRVCSPPVANTDAPPIVQACMAYVLGISDGVTTLSNRNKASLSYCLTSEADALHLFAAVIAYIKTNADRADAPTSVLVIEALSGFWPCHTNK